MTSLDLRFPRYERFDPQVPVWCITPGEGRCIHRFFDTTPMSPSGRYVAVLRLPFEDRMPEPGDAAQVVLVDLQKGDEQVVATTRGWEPQMGANLNWGGDDHTLVFNDVDTQTWTPRLVVLDPLTGNRREVDGGVYHVSPDGRYAAAASMHKMRRTQNGYGVLLPDNRVPRNIGAPDDDGLFITDLQTGDRKLVLPLSEAVRHIPELQGAELADWEVYGFHSKWSPRGDRLIFTIRRLPAANGNTFGNMKHLRFDVLTVNPDGSDVRNAVPAEQWDKGGHHINWFPDGTKLSMNLAIERQGLRLCAVQQDGRDLHDMFQDVRGSGHPTVHPNGRHILTDSYAGEPVAYGDGTVPLRWIDRRTEQVRNIVRTGARTEPQPHGALRVDPHPAWDRTWRWVAFNGVGEDNTRRVFLADMQSLLDEA